MNVHVGSDSVLNSAPDQVRLDRVEVVDGAAVGYCK
jgi:hypothetical protein